MWKLSSASAASAARVSSWIRVVIMAATLVGRVWKLERNDRPAEVIVRLHKTEAFDRN